MVSLLKNHQLENFRLAIVDLSSICFDFGLFSKNFLAPSVTFKFSRTKVITHALLESSVMSNLGSNGVPILVVDRPSKVCWRGLRF